MRSTGRLLDAWASPEEVTRWTALILLEPVESRKDLATRGARRSGGRVLGSAVGRRRAARPI